ncbi:MAG TPA: serine hydrolase [Intrasporangium sp.]|uniref:serine hydrolase n=1 Tax=Intrasporangium sp. TaxID=1925024 RepID=UPI002D7737CF|nr:serine hydrolase [Intrasporangium sp.]HET7397940.1 serine hydrolase [Intrasporangium sp.]
MSVSPFRGLEALLESAGGSGATVSVWWSDLLGVRFARAATVPHDAASTMKLPLVVAAMRRAARGELQLSAPVHVHNEFRSVADGSTYSLDPAKDQDPGTWGALGGTRTVLQLADHALAQSGNLAANLLLDVVGLPEVSRVLQTVGCSPATAIARGIDDATAREAGITNTVTAADLGLIMAAIGRRDTALGGPMVCAPVEAMLARQVHRNMIPAGLPGSVPSANKTGWVPGVAHDVCLVRPVYRPPFVLSVCTTTGLDDAAGAALVASVAREVWRVFTT